MIIPMSLAAIAIFVGYAVAVGCSLAMILSLASAAPDFAVEHFCLRGSYKFVQALGWLVCAAAGGYAAAWVGDRSFAWIEGIALAGVLVTVLWRNDWEARQRGLAHQILVTISTLAGVWLGYMLRY